MEAKQKRKEYQKRYREEHRLEIIESNKRYREEHRDERYKKINCICGGHYIHNHKSRHLDTLKHKKYERELLKTK